MESVSHHLIFDEKIIHLDEFMSNDLETKCFFYFDQYERNQ